MARDILIIPNRDFTGSTTHPEIRFSGLTGASITLKVEDDGTVVFEGDTGGLFEINDSKDGLLSAVSDVSGLPILAVYSDNSVVAGKWDDPGLIVSESAIFVGPTGLTNSPVFVATKQSTIGSGTINSAVIGGSGNTINGTVVNSSILGGGQNEVGAGSIDSLILGGSGNTFTANRVSIIGGISNTIGFTTDNASILGGESNQITGFFGTSDDSTIVGGAGNLIQNSDGSFIIGGSVNTVSNNGGAGADFSGIIGGVGNSVIESDYAIGLGGVFNEVSDNHNYSIVLGRGAQTTSATTFTMGYNGAALSPSSANNTIVFHFGEGDGFWDGTVNGGPADYAEYFEWNDGNVSNEDRVGYFVSLINGKIEIGNTNIVGVVSSVPAVVGDSAPLKWKDMYLKDEFGRVYKDYYNVYLVNTGSTSSKEVYIDSNNNIYSEPPNSINLSGELFVDEILNKVFLRQEVSKKLNPLYDPNEIYTPRKDRPEWSPIGLLGKLRVRTSEQITGSTVSASSNGMAVNGNDYHVLENIKDYDGNYGIVKILYYNK